jgi:hypothetical protein
MRPIPFVDLLLVTATRTARCNGQGLIGDSAISALGLAPQGRFAFIGIGCDFRTAAVRGFISRPLAGQAGVDS